MAERDLDIDLRVKYIEQAQRHQPRLPQPLRQLGAVGTVAPPRPVGQVPAVVKGWTAAAGGTAQHLQYLQRAKGRAGQDAALFNGQGPVQDLQRFQQQAQADPRQFRWVVSPGHGRVPTMAYIQILMRQVEREAQRQLDWLAALHHDRHNVHAHILIRGRDVSGRPLYFHTHFLQHTVRSLATLLAAALLSRSLAPHRTHQPARRQGRDRGEGYGIE